MALEEYLELKLTVSRKDKLVAIAPDGERDSPRSVLTTTEQWTASVNALRKFGLHSLANKLEQMFAAAVPGKQPQVFLLYCKDPPPGKTTEQFCDEVLALVDLLNRIGGIKCECDQYYSHQPNWSLWIEKMISESDFVLLLCSPMMIKFLKSPNHELVEMTQGKFYADSIPNYIDPEKFIPVFLNSDWQHSSPRLQLVPTKLHTVTHYELRVGELISRMGDISGMTAEQFAEQLSELLREPVFRHITALLTHLRKESYTPQPFQPQQQMKLPSPPQPVPDVSETQKETADGDSTTKARIRKLLHKLCKFLWCPSAIHGHHEQAKEQQIAGHEFDPLAQECIQFSLESALTPNFSLWKLQPQPFSGRFIITNEAAKDIYVIASYGGTILAKQKIPKDGNATIHIKTLSPYYIVAAYACQEDLDCIADNSLQMMAEGLLTATGVFALVGAKVIHQALVPVSGVATVDRICATVANGVEVKEDGITKTVKALIKCSCKRYTFRPRIAHGKGKKLVVNLIMKSSTRPSEVKWLTDETNYDTIMQLELTA